jgi:hypothetical protein
MAFRVHKKDHHYVTISCQHLRDVELSYQAMGMLSFMLSNCDNFKYSIVGLAKCASNGESSVRTILNELKEKGYLIVTPIKASNGRIECWDYDFFESPQDAKDYLENPDVENPDVETCRQSNNNISNINISKESRIINNTPKESVQQSIFEEDNASKEKVLSEDEVIQIIVGFWNTQTNFIKIRDVKGTRRKLLVARLKEEGIDVVIDTIKIASQSEFLTENGR